jgi:hypothetical protein
MLYLPKDPASGDVEQQPLSGTWPDTLEREETMATTRKPRRIPATFLTAVAVAVAGSLALVGAARADGDSRPITVAEKAFHARIRQALIKALPVAPPGWAVEGEEGEPSAVSTGSEKLPYRFTWHTRWNDTKRAQEAQAALAETLVPKLKNIPPAQMEAAINETMRKMTPRDVEVLINVTVNHFYEPLPKNAVSAPAVAGALSWRTPSEYQGQTDWREGTTWVVLGKGWKHVTTGGFWLETAPNKGIGPLELQALVVRIQADPARARTIVEKTDWESLKKLLRN